MKKIDKEKIAGKGKGFVSEFKSFVLRGKYGCRCYYRNCIRRYNNCFNR